MEGCDWMKLEKVNDHQIRCTLTKADLADREIKLSELAYGTEKAKNLFRDMMQQAAYEFGFEAEDIPLMIEAIPLSSECIVLIITKVEDPEELDTRFSNFAPSIHEEDNSEIDEMIQSISEETDNVLDLFKKIREERNSSSNTVEKSKAIGSKTLEKQASKNISKAYSFEDVDSVAKLAHILEKFYSGKSSLYRDDRLNKVVLVLSMEETTQDDFNRACNMISEYGKNERYTAGLEAYYEEHDSVIIKDNALQKLLLV